MTTLTPDELARKIHHIRGEDGIVLFAGSGIGLRVGLPDWATFIKGLAKVAEEFGDRLSADLIRERVTDGNLVGAASVYKTSKKIPDGEKLKRLALPFVAHVSDDKLGLLDPLFRLKFSAMVTTNYDRVLHDAYAAVWHRTAIPAERDDGTLKNTAMRMGYIARIHGRAEKPEHMIVDDSDYLKLEQDPTYLDFLLELLRARPCLFVGFSFLDPAIASVLRVFRSKVGPCFPKLHTAILPDSSSGSLSDELRSVNIDTIYYRED